MPNKGLFKYLTFGLRENWVYEFLEKKDNFFKNNILGPKQFISFIYYLKDSELIYKNNEISDLTNLIIRNLINKPFYFWSLIWVNLSFNSLLFNWWNGFPKGDYNYSQIIHLLSIFYGKNWVRPDQAVAP